MTKLMVPAGTLTNNGGGAVTVNLMGQNGATGPTGSAGATGPSGATGATGTGGGASMLVGQGPVRYYSSGSTYHYYTALPLTAGDILILAVSTQQYNVSTVSSTNVSWSQIDTAVYNSGNWTACDLWMGVVSASAVCDITISMAGAGTAWAVVSEFSGLTGTRASHGSNSINTNGNLTFSSISSSSGNLVVVAFSNRGYSGIMPMYGGVIGLSSGEESNAILPWFNFGWAKSSGAAITIVGYNAGASGAVAGVWGVIS